MMRKNHHYAFHKEEEVEAEAVQEDVAEDEVCVFVKWVV